MDEYALGDLWTNFITSAIKGSHWPDYHWYSGHTASAYDDFELCKEDAERGDERAQDYMVRFLAWRMKG